MLRTLVVALAIVVGVIVYVATSAGDSDEPATSQGPEVAQAEVVR